MMPTACVSFMMPEFTKPTTMTVVAEDDWITAVTPAPKRTALKNCADLIDAIYVQERTDDTDAQCEAAKAAWDLSLIHISFWQRRCRAAAAGAVLKP